MTDTIKSRAEALAKELGIAFDRMTLDFSTGTTTATNALEVIESALTDVHQDAIRSVARAVQMFSSLTGAEILEALDPQRKYRV